MKKFFKSIYVHIFRFVTVRKFKKFGKGSFIGAHASIKGGKCINIGNNVSIGEFCRMQCYKVFADVKLSPKIIIKDGCYICNNFTVLSGDMIELEENVLVASNVTICSENHGINPEIDLPYKSQPLCVKPVVIGEGTWVGQNAVIMPGVKIGKKCIIGASAVVTKDVEDYCMVVGIPAKVIKRYDFNVGKWVSCKKDLLD